MRVHRVGLLVAMLVVAGGSACSEDEDGYIELPELTAAPLGRDGGIIVPSGATLCTGDDGCDDGLDCTRDVCEEGVYCRHLPQSDRCSDDVFCNGLEYCDPQRGCLPGIARDCDDGDQCTVDHCDEEAGACVNEPRDFDGDGEMDWHCFGGTDCDDFDVTRSAATAEVCNDYRDNDCDDLIDEAGCGAPPHDECENALDITEGGTFELVMSGAVNDYTSSCQLAAVPDVVATFELEAAMDVQITARARLLNGGEELASVALRRDCAQADSELECVPPSFPAHARMRALPAGRYYVIVKPDATNSSWVKSVLVSAKFSEATDPPPNMTCASALDISEGGRFSGSFVDVSDDLTTPCAVPANADGVRYEQGDLVYTFTTTEAHDVTLTALTLTNDPLVLSLRSTCEDAEATLRCDRSLPASVMVHELPAGTYYVILESPVVVEAEFEFDLRFGPPTPPPAGDDCRHVEPLVLDGAPRTINLAEHQPEIPTSCGAADALDTVFQVDVSEPTDLNITVDSTQLPVWLAVQSVCGSEADERLCKLNYGAEMRLRDVQPGSYFVVVESRDAREVNLSIELEQHSIPTPVAGNDSCATAAVLTASEQVFVGETTGMSDAYTGCVDTPSPAPDSIFRVDLPVAATVRANVVAEFDAVLYRLTADETLGADYCAEVRSTCTDRRLGEEQLEESLPAGTYYYAVDGYDANSFGEYILDFTVM